MDRLREAMHRFCEENRLHEDVVFALDLCLEELVTNVIFYGYNDKNEHWIEVTLDLQDNFVHVQIRDDGIPFDPTQSPEPDLDLPLEERKIGGLGIHLVKNYVDSIGYKRDGSFNITTLKKKTF